MLTFIAVAHIIICVVLILFILIQNPKGGALGVFGGQSSSKSVFNSAGSSDFLVKVSSWLAVIFALTCIYMAYISSQKKSSVVLDSVPTQSVPKPSQK